MNNVGEKIDAQTIGQRGFDVQDLFNNLRRLMTVWSWGAHAWTYHKDQFLRFKVQGRKFKGHIYIILGWDDTFTLYFATTKGTIVKKMEMIYVDVLVRTIDEYVETNA